MKRQALAAAVTAGGLALLAAPAQAAQPHHRWTHVARPPIPKPMPEVHYEQCPGNDEVSGCYIGIGNADQSGRVFSRGAIFLRTRDRFTKLHELGHAFDETMMDASEREEYTKIRGQRLLLWIWSDELENGTVVAGLGTPAEAFADAYANCRMGHTPYGLWEAGYDYYPTPREHYRVCRLIARAGLDFGSPVAVDGSR